MFQVLALAVLAALSVGGLLYAVFYSRIQDEQQRQKRFASVSTVVDKKGKRSKVDEAAKRRKQVGDALNELDKQSKDIQKSVKKPPLKILILQAGLNTDIKTFYMYSAGAAFALFLVALVASGNILVAAGAAFVGGFGLPRWVVGYMRKRRINAFLLEFPNALDIIVRSIKSGLPLNDGLKLIALEAKEPVRTEFSRIIEGQQMGLGTPEAILRMYQTMPVQEANFFAVVIQIQQQAGGNLAEALGNLSNVLRARKSMKQKVAAMSMEAKASAWIIGSLPFAVTILIYMTTPAYLMPLFTDPTGHIILAASGIWMSIGIFIMKQMINFEV